MLDFIEITGAREHNLKNVSLKLPKNKFIVFTGLSGSGKSSLAFDTIYAEGQRRYVESLSAYARQFLQMHNKPDVDSIKGLSPAIAIDQKTTSKNPRSTVGTITEIYDYLRLLFARIGVPYSPATGKPIEKQSSSQISEQIQLLKEGVKVYILSPIVRGQKGEHKKELQNLLKAGFQRVKINNILYELDDLPQIDKNKKNDIELVVDRIVINQEAKSRISDSVETALKYGEGILKLEILPEQEGQDSEIIVFSEKFACPISGFSLQEIEPRIFSFNSPFGACPECEGIGTEEVFDNNLIVQDTKLSIKEGAIEIIKFLLGNDTNAILEALSKKFLFSLEKPFEKLSEEIQKIILYGTNEELEIETFQGLFKKRSIVKYPGIINLMQDMKSDGMFGYDVLSKYLTVADCKACGGFRLKSESLCVKVAGLNIGEVSRMNISDCLDWFENIELKPIQKQIGERVIKEIKERLTFLINVGLDYLTIARGAGTLSGGESQRIRLASQIGSSLTGVLYVLDEPSIGLHQADNGKLITTLKSLAELGNTVIVVEHDEETMLAADHLVDIGPGAGLHGGNIIAQGTPDEVAHDKDSITGKFLSGREFIAIPKSFRNTKATKQITIHNVTTNNLKNVTVSFPLSSFISVTGVSGGGKSSLIIQTFYKAAVKLVEGQKPEARISNNYEKITGLEYIDKIIQIDQSPIGRTPRSNPATYIGVFDLIRAWFVNLPESKARGYKVGRFSFNVKGGRCETCQGDGVIKIEMHFLPDVYVNCDECGGKRYNKETLEICYKEKSISDILNMTVEESLNFFNKMPNIRDKIQALFDVGLGYIKIGQSATTLSGGEAQRVKLAKELSKRSTGRTLYILDEPTTGLHSADVKRLLGVLQKFVSLGNTVLVIEHNMDVIKTSDYIVDVGPGGGSRGGKIVATGNPDEIAQCSESITGQHLRHYLAKARSFEKLR